MKSWRDFADSQPKGCAVSVERADSPAPEPNGTIGTNGTELSAAVWSGLNTLTGKRAPRGLCPDRWTIAVADARRLGAWAARAHALGWNDLDLFGCVPSVNGNASGDGLAVWLDGRRLVAICDTFAVAAGQGGGRSYYHRGANEGATLLWALGDGR